MDWVPINWGIIKNPLNWLIVILMVLIAGFAFDVFASFISDKGNS